MYKLFLFTFIVLPFILITACSSTTASFSRNEVMAMQKSNPTSDPRHADFFQGNPTTVWYKLQHTPTNKLKLLLTEKETPTERGWIVLALIHKRYSNSKDHRHLAQQIIDWQMMFPSHPANALLPSNSTLVKLTNPSPPKHLAVLLPQRGNFAPPARKVREGILKAYYANMNPFHKQSIRFYDTTQNENIADTYQKAVSQGADFIIGPLSKSDVTRLKQQGDFSVPVIALNYAENNGFTDNFYEYGLLPEDESAAAAERAYQNGLSQAIVIAPDTAWGKRVTESFSNQWQALGGSIKANWFFNSRENFTEEVAKLLQVDIGADKRLMREANNREILEQQRRQDFDVIFLFSQAQDARVIVPLLHYYYVRNIPIYGVSATYDGRLNSPNDNDLNDITICDIPWSLQTSSPTNSNLSGKRLYAVGQDAYLLSQSMTQLNELPNFPLYGKTGILTLTGNQQIHRRIPCRVMRNGTL